MNLVDSSGWIEYLIDGPNAVFFAKPIADIKSLLVPTICLFEVHRRISQIVDRERASKAIAYMEQGLVVPLDGSIALRASSLSMQRKFHMADSFIYATALLYDATIWTQDAHFTKINNVRMPK